MIILTRRKLSGDFYAKGYTRTDWETLEEGDDRFVEVKDIILECPKILFNLLELETDMTHQQKFNIHKGFEFILRQRLLKLEEVKK